MVLIRRTRSIECGNLTRIKAPSNSLKKYSRTFLCFRSVKKQLWLLRCLFFLLSRWTCLRNTSSWKTANFYHPFHAMTPFMCLAFNSYPAASSFVGRKKYGGSPTAAVIVTNLGMGIVPALSASPSDGKSESNNVDSTTNVAAKPYQQPGLHSYQTALCIVPVEEIWDTIQKARHVTGDETIYIWPPSIRLFHPFVPPSDLSQAALDAASMVVEKFLIEPFQVVLDSFVIIPYYILDAENRLISRPDDTESTIEASGRTDHPNYYGVQELIAKEEQRGKEKLKLRQLRRNNSTVTLVGDDDNHNNSNNNNNNNSNNSNNNKAAMKNGPPQRKRGRPSKRFLEEEGNFLSTMDDSSIQSDMNYDGPCFLCLQPSHSSRAKLQKLRNALKRELFSHYNAFAAGASTVANVQTFPASTVEKRPKPPPFRPLITLGRFQTVSQAHDALHRLKSFWSPLTFNVTDLHFVSQAELTDVPGVVGGMSYLSNEAHFLYQSKQQFECDSLVSLIGEEPVENNLDDDEESLLFDLVCQEGVPGTKGTVINLDDLFQEKEKEAKIEAREMMMEAVKLGIYSDLSTSTCVGNQEFENNRSLEQLLSIIPEVEEDYNKGATIVIGRTQFFLGQMREYVGMPASNPIDSKDRVLGQGVSGAARRKPAVHRTGDRWSSGDYGTKSSDSFV